MIKEIEIDKFRYWLVISYLFKEAPKIDNYLKKRDDSQISLCRYIGKDCYGFRSVAKICSKESYELYVVPENFLQNKDIVLAFVKLNREMAQNYISDTTANLDELRKNIFLDIKSSEIFGTDIENLLDSSPIFLSIEPIEEGLFTSSYPSEDEIENTIKMLGAHKTYWSVVFDHILASSKYFGAPWEKLIVINIKNIGDRDNQDINVTDFFLSILKQATLFHLLNHRKKQLNDSALSKFDIQNLTSGTSLKEISVLHSNLLSALGQFYDNHILLTNELPMSKELDGYFLKSYGVLKDSERIKESNEIRLASIMERLFEEVSKSLYETEQNLSLLSSKATTLSSYSQDRLNTEISKINLNLTKKLTWLTYVIVVLTIILVLGNVSVKTLINIFFN